MALLGYLLVAAMLYSALPPSARALVRRLLASLLPAPATPAGPVADWDSRAVAAWLRSSGLDEYVPTLAGCDGRELSELSLAALRARGFARPAEAQRRLSAALRAWQTEAAATEAADAAEAAEATRRTALLRQALQAPASAPPEPPPHPACVAVLRAHAGWATAVAWLPCGALLSGGGDGCVRLWPADRLSGPPACVLEGHAGCVRALLPLPAADSDGGAALLSGGEDGTLRLWRISPARDAAVCEQLLSAHADALYALAALPRGALSGGADGAARVWRLDGAAGEPRLRAAARSPAHGDWVTALAPLQPGEGGRLFATACCDGRLRLWDAGGGWEEDGDGYDDPGREDTQLACVRTLRGHAGGVRALLSLPADRLLSGGVDGVLRLWHAPSGACERLLPPQPARAPRAGACLALAMLPPAAAGAPPRLAHACEGGGLLLWAMPPEGELQLLETLHGHAKKVYALALRPAGAGGAVLASASRDRSVRLWTVQ